MTDVARREASGPASPPSGSSGPRAPRSGLRAGAPPWTPPSPVGLALLSVILYLPFIGFGYGTDIDITNIRRSGESILEGDYHYSRPPGAFVHELVTGVLDSLGGAVLVNLGSVVMAVVTLVMLARIVDREHGPRAGRIAVVVLATQPWFWVAATSLGDYLYALGFLLVGVDAARRDARIVAGLAFGLAIGSRGATGLLVAAWLLAEASGPWLDRDRSREPGHVRGMLITAGVAGVLGVLWFIPPWLSAGRTARFLENQLVAGDFWVMVGRWGVKNIAFLGVVTILVLLVRLPVLLEPLGRFRHLVLVRFAVLAAIATEVLYLRFPWKPVHLLPIAVCVAILLAASSRTSNRLVAAVVGAQLLLAAVSITIAEPDVVDAATGGSLAPGLTRGVVVNELACRTGEDFIIDYEGDWPDLDTPDADYAAIGAFACQARSWRAGEGPESPEDVDLEADVPG